MKKKKAKSLITEYEYTIEALTEEIHDLEETIREKHERIVELIGENDRLTLTYEPYRPPGDVNEGLDFYTLVEENQELTRLVKDLQAKNSRLTSELIDIRTSVAEMKIVKEKKYPKAGVVSLDFWPPRDWFRFNWHRWNPGKAAQFCIGPIRIDWFQS